MLVEKHNPKLRMQSAETGIREFESSDGGQGRAQSNTGNYRFAEEHHQCRPGQGPMMREG